MNSNKMEATHNGKDLTISVRSSGGSQCARIKCETVGEYSVTAEKFIELGRRNARIFSPPTTEFSYNLNIGFEKFDDYNDKLNRGLNLFSSWLLKTVEEGQTCKEIMEGVHVVVARGLLRRVASTPSLGTYVDWKFIAQKIHGIVFISADDEGYTPTIESPILSVYHGMNFEGYITRAADEDAPNPTLLEKSNEQFRTVCRFEVAVNRKKFVMLVNGEVDAVDEAGYVEIKLAKQSPDGLLPFSKCIKTWLQCTLAGVNKVVLGYKDEQGFVKKVNEIKKNDLVTNMSRSGRIPTQKTFLFLHKVIEQVHDNLQNGESCTVEYKPGAYQAVLTPLSEEKPLLSEEFIEILNEM